MIRRFATLLLLLGFISGCGSPAAPDALATGVTVARAVAATLTAEALAGQAAPASSPDPIATGVALQQAIAATLTAGAPTTTSTPISLPTPRPDLVATAVALHSSVAATLTAGATVQAAAAVPAKGPAPSSEPASIPPTPAPSFTPSATQIAVAPEASPAPPPSSPPDCVPWSSAAAYVGTEQCICGVVVETYDSPSSTAFFINFSTDRTGYYAVSFDHTFAGLEGRCLKICGLVETYRDRPQTIIRDPGQIQEMPACP